MIKQECIGIPDMILLLMIFCFKKIKIKAEIVLSPGGAYFGKEEVEYRNYCVISEVNCVLLKGGEALFELLKRFPRTNNTLGCFDTFLSFS